MENERLRIIDQFMRGNSTDDPEAILPCERDGSQPTILEVIQPELGMYVQVKMDPIIYEEHEALDVADMLIRVVSSWWRRREVMNSNPETYGFRVN